MKKKNTVLGVLLLAVVITSYSVSGTYAKYISKVGGTDDARVAEWSFNSKGDFDLFKSSYSHEDGTSYVKSLNCEFNDDGTVKEGTCDDIVAPGTKGEYSFQLVNGDFISEVNYMLTMDIQGTNSIETLVSDDDIATLQADTNAATLLYTKTEADGDKNYYSPIKFRLYKGTDAAKTLVTLTNGKEETNQIDVLVASIKDAYKEFASLDKVQAPNKDDNATALLNAPYTIEWEWDYSNPTTDTDIAALLSKYDTKIANESTAAAEDAKYNVSITFDVVAEQTKCAAGEDIAVCKASANR